MKGFETAKFTSNSVLQEFRLTWLENAKTTFLLLFFVVIKCADVHEKTWLLLPFYVNVWVKFYYQRFTIYRYKYFRCGRPFCYFRLSVVVAIIWRHFPLTRDGRKPQHYRNTVGILTLSIVVPDFRISGLGGHISLLFPAVSRCRNHFLWTRLGRNPRHAIGNEHICCST